jgi:endoglucanase
LKYWKDGGQKPSEDFAKKALMKMADNYKMQNVTVKPDVIDAMFRQVQTNDTKPYKKHVIPGKIIATQYDLGTNGYAYSDKDFVNYRVATGNYDQWNKGNTMRNDGVDILPCKDSGSNGYQVSFIEDGEWLQFTSEVKKQNSYKVAIRYSSESSEGKLHLETENGNKCETITLAPTGEITNGKTIVLSGIKLNSGTNKIKVVFEKGGFNLNYLDFSEGKK